jgi:AraC-like DNA-binding protein
LLDAEMVLTCRDRRAAIEKFATIPPQVLFYTNQELEARGFDLGQNALWRPVYRMVVDGDRPHVTFNQSQSLIHEAIRVAKDPDLGLAVGRRQNFASAGLLSAGLLASQTQLDALRLGVKYHRLTGSMLDLHLVETEEGAMALTGSSRDPKSMIFRFLIQELFTNVTQISRFLFRHGNPLERVEFTFKTKNPAIFRAAFNCPTQFGASENRLIFSRQALHVALETADAFALKTVEQALNGLMEQERRQQTLVTHIESILLTELAETPAISEIADRLAMSERSLRRKLGDAGTSYRDVLSRVRQTRAMELIRETDLPLSVIAQALGFDDTRSLRRNVKLWTDQSARALRNETALD